MMTLLPDEVLRRRPLMYLSLLGANIGAIGFVASVTAEESDWYTAVLLVLGVINLFWIAAYALGIRWRAAEEGFFVNGAWFVLVAIAVAEVSDWHEYGWGLSIVMVSAGIAVWGLWIDARTERKRRRR